ncbi:MAG: tRNA pseudouridine(38-40) synthase TruA [Ruminococcaceae bacterium]|nr:tRNA pseudouridine(38-40) synthase TruA [Oscillospiraceae bacterium]
MDNKTELNYNDSPLTKQAYKLRLMYEGTHYSGWQRQDNAVTVQGELEKALSVIFREPISVTGVSRTDAGVHAADYTANFHASVSLEPRKICRGVNALLPQDIRVFEASPCDMDFSSRFDAMRKTYLYHIDCSLHGNVFYRHIAWHHPMPLDIESMQKAAGHFLGEHDFSAFMAQGGSAKTFTRHIMESDISCEGDLVTYRITGNGFLYNMVRIITGTLVWVGRGKLSADDMPALIAARDRTRVGMTAPAHGLMLLRAEYEN